MDLRDNHPYLIGYHISNVGKIYSRVKGYWRELTPCINREGYLRIKLNGKQYSIHRLVAEAYIPNPENKPCVCHKDNNKLNNSVDNLYWGTQKENLEQMIKDGRSLKVEETLCGKIIIILVMVDMEKKQQLVNYQTKIE